MARPLRSARLRRRLTGTLCTLGLAGSIAAVVLLLPEQNGPAPSRPTSNEPRAVYHPPKPVRYTAAERSRAAGVMLAFVQSAVIRRHLSYSYDLTTPSLHQGLTRRRWETGEIPIVPFPVGTDLRGAVLVESIRNELDYRVSLFPPKASGVEPAVYDLKLRRIGRAWLVDSWAPSIRGLFGPNAIPDGPPNPNQPIIQSTNPHLSRQWAYAPIAFLVFALLLAPLVLGGRCLIDSRRARRVQRSMANGR